MIDVQVVQIKNLARISDITFATVLRVDVASSFKPEDSLAYTQEVLVNGESCVFTKFDMTTLFIYVPELDTSKNPTITLRKQVTAGGDVEQVTLAAVLNSKLPAGSMLVSTDSGLLKITGNDFTTASQVFVNGQEQKFIKVSNSVVLATVPKDAQEISEVDVVISETTASKSSFFDFSIGDRPVLLKGINKVVQQFVKLLYTTVGTDVFYPSVGGDLQKWVGSNNPDNQQGVTAKILMSVLNIVANMQTVQLASSLPDDEKIAAASILSVNVDPADPTSVSISVKIQTVSGVKAVFDTLLKEAETLVKSKVGAQHD